MRAVHEHRPSTEVTMPPATVEPAYIIQSLPTEIVAGMHSVLGELVRVERAALSVRHRKQDEKVRGLLSPHTSEEMEELFCDPGAEALTLQVRDTFEVVGMFLYYRNSCPRLLQYLPEAIERDPVRQAGQPYGIAEVCCIKPGPWQGSYPDLHARMVLKMREANIPFVYGMCHVDNPILRKHRALGYEHLQDENGERMRIVRMVSETLECETASYYLMRLTVNSVLQDRLCEEMRSRSLPYDDLTDW